MEDLGPALAYVNEVLRRDFPSLVIGILIGASGLGALGVFVLRVRNRSGLLLSFGALAALYGIRVLLKNSVIHVLFPSQDAVWQFGETTISNFILVPAILFAERIYGRGWRSGMRVLVWLMLLFGIAGTALNYFTRNPYAVPDPGVGAVAGLVLIFSLSYLKGYRPPPIAHVRALLVGLAIFLLTFLNEHMVNSKLLPWHAHIETFGFFALLCSMGYLAVRNVLDGEQQLLAFEEEMRSAQRIQASILPRETPRLCGAQICVRYLPMTAVAGDFYEFLPRGAECVGIALADVAGHGVPAALVASMVKVAIDSQSGYAADPPALMAGLNQIMCRQAQGKLITAGYLYLDLTKKRGWYSAAAHPPLLVRRRSTGTVLEFKENGLILGVRPGESYEAMSFELLAGDRVLLYTDGIAEAANASDELFSDARMAEVLASHDGADAATFADLLLRDVRDWARMDVKGQADDMTLLVIDIT